MQRPDKERWTQAEDAGAAALGDHSCHCAVGAAGCPPAMRTDSMRLLGRLLSLPQLGNVFRMPVCALPSGMWLLFYYF